MYKNIVLITGGYGFIGAKYLLENVVNNPNNLYINVDKLTYASNIDYLKPIEKKSNYIFYECDICDFEKMEKILNKYKINTIINFAAESHVDNSINNPNVFLHTNIIGVNNILEIIKNKNILFVQISTDEVYGDIKLDDSKKFCEDDKMNPSSVYSSSKASAELLVKSYNRMYGQKYLITRCCNNFGPNQNFEKFIPKIITNCFNSNSIPIYGNGSNCREWIYVSDHILALDFLLNKKIINETINIGSDFLISNNDLVHLILNQIDSSKLDLIKYVNDRIGHDLKYNLNCNKLLNLGFKNIKKDINEEIIKTIKWYRSKNEFSR